MIALNNFAFSYFFQYFIIYHRLFNKARKKLCKLRGPLALWLPKFLDAFDSGKVERLFLVSHNSLLPNNLWPNTFDILRLSCPPSLSWGPIHVAAHSMYNVRHDTTAPLLAFGLPASLVR
jgi:hypothetical protein